MNCQKCKNEIEERDLRRESLSDAAEAHLSACADCRVFGAERLALRRLVGGLEKVSAPADFDFRMRARMVAERGDRAPRAGGLEKVSARADFDSRMRARMVAERGDRAPRAKWFNFSPAALSWPLAACLALVISATLYFQTRRPETPLSRRAAARQC